MTEVWSLGNVANPIRNGLPYGSPFRYIVVVPSSAYTTRSGDYWSPAAVVAFGAGVQAQLPAQSVTSLIVDLKGTEPPSVPREPRNLRVYGEATG